jgi:hypothetical protein
MHEDDGFKTWMEQVNDQIYRKCGLGADDLPDWCYRDAYDARTTPRSAASQAVRAAKDY